MALDNKVIVITGGSSGMGFATANLALKKGAKVVIGARNEDKLKDAVSKSANPDNITYKVTDVTKADDVKNLVQSAKDRFGRVDIMYNNAGIMPVGPLSDGDTESWRNMLNINVMGVLNGIAAVLPIMKEQGYGHILATDSMAGHIVYPDGAVYIGSKFAVRSIMEGLRQEEHNNGIKTSIVSPGVVSTNLFSTVHNQEIKKGFVESTKQKNGTLYPEDIARSVVYMMEQPDNVDINEIKIRPKGQDI